MIEAVGIIFGLLLIFLIAIIVIPIFVLLYLYFVVFSSYRRDSSFSDYIKKMFKMPTKPNNKNVNKEPGTVLEKTEVEDAEFREVGN